MTRMVIVTEDAWKEINDLLALIDADGTRAKMIHDDRCDAVVHDLCERVGYGAVMDSAARQWFLKDDKGAFVIGSCAMLVRMAKDKIAASPGGGRVTAEMVERAARRLYEWDRGHDDVWDREEDRMKEYYRSGARDVYALAGLQVEGDGQEGEG